MGHRLTRATTPKPMVAQGGATPLSSLCATTTTP